MDLAGEKSLAEARKRWGCAAILALLLAVAGFGIWMVERDLRPAAGREVGTVAFFDDQGQRHTLAEFNGKFVVVDVWATWCPPCRMSLPEIASLQAATDGRWVVLPISTDKGGFLDVAMYQKRAGLSFRAYVPAGEEGLAPFGAIYGIPTTILIGPDGKVRARWSGYYPGRAEKELKEALRN